MSQYTYLINTKNEVISACEEGPKTVEELIAKYIPKDSHPYVLARQGSAYLELNRISLENELITLIDISNKVGLDVYHRSVLMLMLSAMNQLYTSKEVSQIRVHSSVGNGYFCTIQGEKAVDFELLSHITQKMKAMVKLGLPIERKTMTVREGRQKFLNYEMYEKSELFKYRRSSHMNMYFLDGYYNYFYGEMVPNTSYLSLFKLYQYRGGFILNLPGLKNPGCLERVAPENNVLTTIIKSIDWNKKNQVPSVAYLNKRICDTGIESLVLMSEAYQEQQIAKMASEIVSHPDKKVILIAGPSSSGKTTTSQRLALQLEASGLKPHTIAADHYFKPREETPLDENGERNYEALEAIDLKLFDEHINALLDGEKVELPYYQFKTGLREWHGDFIQLGEKDLLIIEGIHCLNPEFMKGVERQRIYKIYISALTQLNIDEHNRIPTTDGRLIRRMVRDDRLRGVSAKETLARWASVRRGEEEYIFPYQKEADMVYNSNLNYELGILKVYAEPLLFRIEEDDPSYLEARRLLKFLDSFISIPDKYVPTNSVLREFIGGGCFNV